MLRIMDNDEHVISPVEMLKIIEAVRSMLPYGAAAYVAIYDPEVGSPYLDIGGGTHELPNHHVVVLRNLAKSINKEQRARREKEPK